VGITTFRTFPDVVRELEEVYGHKELWLYSGIDEDCPVDTIVWHQKWRCPKILKRNGRMVAERTGDPDSWELVGDYKKPHSAPCAPPWQSCLIDDVFKGNYILIGPWVKN